MKIVLKENQGKEKNLKQYHVWFLPATFRNRSF